MSRHLFVTVDVFTDRRFGGNPLAVVTDAVGLSDVEMQSIAAEFNLSETAFVLPPDDPAHTARLRIFNRTGEMPFAGHPTIGAGYVLAHGGRDRLGVVSFEVMAGIARVTVTRGADGVPTGASVAAPQALSLDMRFPVNEIAACAGLDPAEVIVAHHAPILASVGTQYVIAEVTPDALMRAAPVRAAFQRVVDAQPTLRGRCSLFVYACTATGTRARMFAPLAGTIEDPATGSANAALAALLLSLSDARAFEDTVWQGVEMGRPSRLKLTARRTADGIRSSVAGDCVQVSRGELVLD